MDNTRILFDEIELAALQRQEGQSTEITNLEYLASYDINVRKHIPDPYIIVPGKSQFLSLFLV